MFGAALEMSTDLLLRIWIPRAGQLRWSMASAITITLLSGTRMRIVGAGALDTIRLSQVRINAGIPLPGLSKRNIVLLLDQLAGHWILEGSLKVRFFLIKMLCKFERLISVLYTARNRVVAKIAKYASCVLVGIMLGAKVSIHLSWQLDRYFFHDKYSVELVDQSHPTIPLELKC
jgi:hypothetical protein